MVCLEVSLFDHVFVSLVVLLCLACRVTLLGSLLCVDMYVFVFNMLCLEALVLTMCVCVMLHLLCLVDWLKFPCSFSYVCMY